jgi:hypothetical protein
MPLGSRKRELLVNYGHLESPVEEGTLSRSGRIGKSLRERDLNKLH